MSKKILVCFGTRPEAIKMSSLVHELRKSEFEIKVCVTAQHREMLDQVLDFFEITPDFDLNLMTANQTLNKLSGRIFTEMDGVLENYAPDLVLVHGDTTTSSICAWAAFHRGIATGHVEAGLRTYNKYAPFPEEINRQITGRIADFHFAPTETSKNNLLSEHTAAESITVTGNTVIDSLLWTVGKLDSGFSNDRISELESKVDFTKKVILVTGHRRENFGDGFLNICKALAEIASRPDVEIVFPVHLNPNVQKPVNDLLSGYDNIHLTEPLDYPSFVWIMKQATLIITDSGGVQEEAPSLGKPVLVMRETTERPEAVEAGTVKLVGTDSDVIARNAFELLDQPSVYEKMSKAYNPYGDGKANARIVEFLKSKLT
ncbi:non-hydrolyzing UDP-N-acetylglucosamine 2-epimerase [Flavobacterium selenitireducens]|uniref:non-hydrolyzing UDP-N-acetylglucosamine 2-epimerase n=1 Tax=Flavobacterium selenitireducens TaxID=2722704 RepID=UPI00168A9FD9|nr:UDP-N-acetylglucosamine 2-epimerase (non-hydrolyzing) [Flavobacterium selenitireducens]MBD3583461.1 UDP-N-acetylglucosamine 2-epimerase (non-hydrolyzing) [Flavobacterium selenitireducens]